MEICWDSTLFHFALSSPSLSSAFSSHLSLDLLFERVCSVATPPHIIFLFHYFPIKSLSFPYRYMSLPSVSFVSYFSSGQRIESCSFVSLLERRRAESGLLGDERVFPGFTEKEREKGFETLIHGPLSLLFSHFLLFLAKISTRRIRDLNWCWNFTWWQKHHSRYS